MTHQIKSFFKNLGTPAPLPPSQRVPPAPTFEPFNEELSQVYRYRRHVGVNLGCLFCLEGWLAPPELKKDRGHWESELAYLEASPSREAARDALESHWQNFITEQDFAFLSSVGVNAVRLPIGFWVVADQKDLADMPFRKYQGVYDAAWNYFLRTIDYAAKHNIGVLVDLHGAPGGQNRDCHSGTSTGDPQLFKSSGYRSLALRVLERLARILAPINNVIGLEVLNEPADDSGLPGFYRDAIRVIRQVSATLPIYLGDAWNPTKYSDWIASHDDAGGFVVLDTHQYFCHTPADHAKTAEQHTKHLTTGLKDTLARCSARIRGNLIVGEWSVVLNHQSIPKGQHDGDVMRAFGQAQRRVWNAVAAGHFYWTYKTADDQWYWSFIYCHKHNILALHDAPSAGERKPRPKEAAAQQAREQHRNYWSQRQPEVVQHAHLFDQGFSTGYDVAVQFAEQHKSQIGFVGQLAHDYAAAQTTDKANAWQFEHGFVQGVQAVQNA